MYIKEIKINGFKSFADKVNLELNRNFTGIVGPNGSGKSVLLKMICAFYEPTTGEILFDGRNVIKENGFPPNTRAMIEKPSFLPELSGKENLELLAQIQNIVGEKEIDETLKKVGLDPNDKKSYYKYSLGMKQKLNIAQVLMENPKLLILDEPFNGLDDSTHQNIRNIILEEKKKNKIIILASHVKEDLEILCDEIYKFNNQTTEKVKK